LASNPNKQGTYNFSLIGRFAAIGIQRTYTPNFSLGSSAGWSPKFANGSDRIYDSELKREKNLSYDDRELRGDIFAIKFIDSWSIKGGIQTEYHEIRDMTDTESSDEWLYKWDKPQFGLLGALEYRATAAEDLYKDRINGQKGKLRMDSFLAPRSWNRTNFSYAHGTFFGAFYLSQELRFFHGTGLNTVNSHIVGGSWDLLDTNKAYGSRAYQYRLEKGGLVNLRFDYMFTADFDCSLQVGVVGDEDKRSAGVVLKIFKTYKGILYEFGAAHQQTISTQQFYDQFIFTRMTLALFSQ
jgi:hypothetical protein